MKKYPDTVNLQDLTDPTHPVNTTVDQERLLVEVVNKNPAVKAAMQAYSLTDPVTSLTGYDSGLDYSVLAHIELLEAGAGKTHLLNLYNTTLFETAIYEQLNPGFWKMKTLGLYEVTPIWTTGMAAVTDWVTYIDIVDAL
jgi:hypothetical protein